VPNPYNTASSSAARDTAVKLPPDRLVPLEKVTRYLLVPLPRADKSAFLALAGYTADNADRLRQGLRLQILPLDARPTGTTEFGDRFAICGVLRGPNGRSLRVKAIWMREAWSKATRFITLLPDKS